MDPDVNKQDNHGRTKLFMAAKEENLSKCKTLISGGAKRAFRATNA